MLETVLRSQRVATDTTGVPPRHSKTHPGLALLRNIKEMGAKFENLVVGHIKQGKTAATNTGIKPKDKVRTLILHVAPPNQIQN